MENRQIFEKISSIIKSINPNAKIDEETALIEEAVLDSLEFMNYLTKIEESFSIKISDAEISDLRLGIIANMIKYINVRV